MNEKIKQILAPYQNQMASAVRKNRMYAIILTFGIIIGLALMIVAAVCISSLSSGIDMILVIVGAAVLLISGFAFSLYIRKLRRSHSDFLHQDVNVVRELYQTYLDAKQSTTSIIKNEIELDGRKTIATFFFKNALFNYMFETSAWYEVHHSGRSGSYTIYFVNYIFRKKPHNADARSGNLIAEMTTDSMMNHKSDFESESIAFNKMFNVKGNDILAITKMFSPKVIDQLVTIGNGPFKGRNVRLEDNNAGITYGLKTTRNNPHYGLSDFNLMKFSVNGIVRGIIKKIEKDMNLFTELRLAVSPFDYGLE